MQVAALRLVAGLQDTDELPFIAAGALVRGLDSPLLREAAGVAPGDGWEAEVKFLAAANELDMLPTRDKQESLEHLVRHIAASIVVGTSDPVSGAHEIWRLSHDIEREGDLRIFIGLASEAQNSPGYEPDIRRAAAELLARPTLRRWALLQAVEPDGWPVWQPEPRRVMSRDELGLSEGLCSEIEAWVRRLPVGRTTSGWSMAVSRGVVEVGR